MNGKKKQPQSPHEPQDALALGEPAFPQRLIGPPTEAGDLVFKAPIPCPCPKVHDLVRVWGARPLCSYGSEDSPSYEEGQLKKDEHNQNGPLADVAIEIQQVSPCGLLLVGEGDKLVPEHLGVADTRSPTNEQHGETETSLA